MKKIKSNQNGFIPLIIFLVVVLAIVIVLAYLRVSHAHHPAFNPEVHLSVV